MTSTELTQSTAKVVVRPILHESHGRVTRRTWWAAVEPRTYAGETSSPDGIGCGHTSEGHRTTDAAVTCGTRIWKGLPR